MSDTHSRSINRHVLENGKVRVAVLSLGCITQSWEVYGQQGVVPVVLGYDEPELYLDDPTFMGAIIGRTAGRVSRASFRLGGEFWTLEANDGPNQLHGGPGGLHRQHWSMEPDGSGAVRLHMVSPHGDQGYPGRVDLTVTISLVGYTVTYDMQAISDRPTPVSLSQHSYYNLTGCGTIWDHFIKVPADAVLATDDALLPTGTSLSLDGRLQDLRAGRCVAEADPEKQGLDLTYAGLRGQARVRAPNGMHMTLDSDQPCLQCFTGSNLGTSPGAKHVTFGGLCLEPQQYPDAMNRPEFPFRLTTPDQPYRQKLAVRIAPVGAA